MNQSVLNNSPGLPRLFQLPGKWLPIALQHALFVRAMNHAFKAELLEDDMDFMNGRTVAIEILDAALVFRFALQEQRFIAMHSSTRADLRIAGTLYDFLLLIGRREDPDTLFFNRRLKLSGDTELGLYVKNFLDSVDMSERFQWLQNLSVNASRLAERFSAPRR